MPAGVHQTDDSVAYWFRNHGIAIRHEFYTYTALWLAIEALPCRWLPGVQIQQAAVVVSDIITCGDRLGENSTIEAWSSRAVALGAGRHAANCATAPSAVPPTNAISGNSDEVIIVGRLMIRPQLRRPRVRLHGRSGGWPQRRVRDRHDEGTHRGPRARRPSNAVWHACIWWRSV